MLSARHHIFWAALWSFAVVLSGCQSEAPATAPAAARSATPAPSPQHSRAHIDSVDPATLSVSQGDVWINALRVKYHLDAPERVQKAELRLYNSQTGAIARTEIPVAAQGEFNWDVRTTAQIGSTLRLRANCPNGFSNWLALGSLPAGAVPNTAPSTAPRLTNITPSTIKEPQTPEEQDMMDQPGTVVDLTLWGSGFQRDCRAQASIDNGPLMDLTAGFGGSRLLVQIPRSELRYRGVGERYLQLDLIIHGQDPASEDIFHINVTD